MTQNSYPLCPGAIQIIKSVLEKDDGPTKQKQYKISLIEEYKDNEGKRGPALKEVLCGENKNLPIFVISICGKTRTGKSVLLNLMIKYLESEGSENWKDGSMPSVFDWKGGADSVTKGLWICPKVFKRKNSQGKEVGILLLDNQGLYDAEQTDGVSIAISGVSTALCSYQLYNVKDKICVNDLESIWRHLTSDDNDEPEDCSTKLMFIVRDYIDEEKGCGLDHGQTYIGKEKLRGTDAHKDMWKGLQKAFPQISCLLLPFPGPKVRIGNVKELKDIDPDFLEEVDQFFKTIFDPKHLNVTKDIRTGEVIFETLKKFDGRVADESLSFVNVFTEEGNENKFQSLINIFESRVVSFKAEPSNGQSLVEEFLLTAKKRFKGKSADAYLVKLEKFTQERINVLVKDWILRRYQASLQASSGATYTHTLEWESVKWRLTYFVGSESEKRQMKEKVIVGCADVYYSSLRKELQPRFKSYCNNKSLDALNEYDETFVSIEFKENQDFTVQQPATKQQCRGIWMNEKEKLRIFVQNELLEFVAALTEVDKEWLQKATETQYKFYEIFTWNDCHGIRINKNDDSLLELVGYTMYQKVQELCEYSNDEKIIQISKQIRNQSSENSITVTCIFILCHHEGHESCEPVFKVKNSNGYSFVDIKGRAYKNWEDFQEDNKLPSNTLYCHPSQGGYNKEEGFRVSFTWSPASSFGSKLLNVLDVLGKVVAVGSAGAIGAVAAFPALTVVGIGGAISAAVAGGYGLTRSIIKMVDKANHDESVEATDVVEAVANTLSIVTAGATAGAVLFTTIGRELASAPAIIQSISSLTNLVFQLDRENISYLSLANDISMFLLFNSKSLEGAIDNIKNCYNLPPQTSNMDTLKSFIARNSITFPKNDSDILTTEQFFSDSLKTLLLTAVMNKTGKRPLQFLKDVTATSKDLVPLQNVFNNVSSMEEQLKLFEELLTLIGMIFCNKRETNSSGISHRGMGYHPVSDVTRELALAGVCTGLTTISECSGEKCIQQVCTVAKEILQFAYDNTETTDLKGLATYLNRNRDEIFSRFERPGHLS